MQMAPLTESHLAETVGQYENGNNEPTNDEDPDLTGSYAHMEHDESDGATTPPFMYKQESLMDVHRC